MLLNILEHFDLAALDPLGPERFHLMLEAARLAYAVRDTHIADPAFMRCGPGSDRQAFARELAGRIDRRAAPKLPRAPSPGSDTVYLTVVDRDRKAVSLINTLYSYFGVGICTEQTGIMLTNRGACFVVEPAHPNTFGPNKRPMHTIIPALALRDGARDGIRRDGRALPADGPRPACHQHGRLRDGRADSDRCAARVFVGEETVIERGIPAGRPRASRRAAMT